MMKIPIGGVVALLILCSVSAEDSSSNDIFLKSYATQANTVKLPSGIMYTILSSGSGMTPNATSTCEVYYVGYTVDGKEFDSNLKKASPTKFTLGKVIRGWREILPLMREGDHWEVVIPPELAYGDRKKGRIPPNSILVFKMELVKTYEAQTTLFRREHILWLFVIAYLAYNMYQSTLKAMQLTKTHKRIPIESISDLPANPRVYMEIAVDNESLGRIEFELFYSIVPKTAENFRSLCVGDQTYVTSTTTTANNIALTYKQCTFHRIIPGFMIQGGDITLNNGRGGCSIYGKSFKDEFEHGYVEHAPMMLSMANAGPDTNNSQFFITTAATPWLDQKHVVFGRVVAGEDVVKKVELYGSSSGNPKCKVTIVACGEVTNSNKKDD